MIEPAWDLLGDIAFETARVREHLVAAIGRGGETALVDADGNLRWSTDATYPAAAMTLGARHVVTAHHQDRWRLRATDHAGAVAWEVELDAARVARLFSDGRGRVLVLLNRDGRFRVDIHREDDGHRTHTRALDRRRAVADPHGRFVWTRDASGASGHDLPRGTHTSVALDGDGPMTACKDRLLTVTGDALACFRGDEVDWETRVPGRDLTELARQDGLADAGEEDFWEPELGRPIQAGELACVADLNGQLHAFELATGTSAWTFASAHYPSSLGVAMPAFTGEHILFPASDEHLYLVDMQGEQRDALDLGFPFEGPAVPVPGESLVILPCNGLRAFRVG